MQYGWQTPTCLPKVVDSWIYAEMRNEALINSGQPAAFTPEQIAYYRNGGPNCKWIEEIYKKNAPQQSHNLSFSGGNDKTTFWFHWVTWIKIVCLKDLTMVNKDIMVV